MENALRRSEGAISMSELTRKIKTAGYTEVSVRPGRFVADRIQPVTALFPLIERAKVSLRGWDYPHIDRNVQVVPEQDSVAQESEWGEHLEAWRFYQSGQFVSLRALRYDWRDQSGFWPADAAWRRGAVLPIEDVLFTFAEIFESAARLSSTPAGDDPMYVEVTFGGLRDRRLAVSDPRRADFFEPPAARIDSFPQLFVVPRAELLAEPRGLAVRGAQELFRRFGEELATDLLRDWLAQLIRR
jgi:hypothetical protein